MDKEEKKVFLQTKIAEARFKYGAIKDKTFFAAPVILTVWLLPYQSVAHSSLEARTYSC